MRFVLLSTLLLLASPPRPPSSLAGPAAPRAPVPAPRAQDEPAQGLDARLAALLEDFVAREQADELDCAIALGEHTLLAREPASRASRADASALRPFCLSVLALVLVREGVLSLDEPVSERLPGLGEVGARVRVRHLLARTSGLPACEPYFVEHPARADFDLAAFVAWLAAQPVLAEPGRCWAAVSTDELLLGMLIELAQKRSASVALEEKLFAPLGMTHSARVIDREGRGVESLLGRLESSAADLVRLQRALATGSLLPLDAQRPLVERARLPDGTPAGPGLGYRPTSVRAEGDGLLAGGACAGAEGARAALLAYHPEQELSIALLAPVEEDALAALEQRLARALAGLADEQPLELPLSAEDLRACVGSYWAGCLELELRAEGDALVLVPAFRSPVRLLHQGELRFVAAEDTALTLELVREPAQEGGAGQGGRRVAKLVLEDHGTRLEARKH